MNMMFGRALTVCYQHTRDPCLNTNLLTVTNDTVSLAHCNYLQYTGTCVK